MPSLSLTRRAFTRSATAVGVGATIAGSTRVGTSAQSATVQGQTLRILAWKHVLDEANNWLGQFASQWGDANGVAVRVDLVDAATITHAMQVELARGEGHDLFFHAAPVPFLADQLVDLADVATELSDRHGRLLSFADRDSLDPETGARYGIMTGYIPTAFMYRPTAWAAIGESAGPTSWDALRTEAPAVWTTEGMSVALGMGTQIASSVTALAVLWANGAIVQDAQGELALASQEAIDVVAQVRDLYQTAMLPASLKWDEDNYRNIMLQGAASATIDGLDRFRLMQARKADVAIDTILTSPLVGSAGFDRAVAPAAMRMLGMIPTYTQFADAGRAFLLALVDASEQIATASRSTIFPTYPDAYAGLRADGGPLDSDPTYPDQGTAVSALKKASGWTVQLGWPGPTTRTIAQAVDEGVLPQMFAQAASGERTPVEAVGIAARRLKTIANR